MPKEKTDIDQLLGIFEQFDGDTIREALLNIDLGEELISESDLQFNSPFISTPVISYLPASFSNPQFASVVVADTTATGKCKGAQSKLVDEDLGAGRWYISVTNTGSKCDVRIFEGTVKVKTIKAGKSGGKQIVVGNRRTKKVTVVCAGTKATDDCSVSYRLTRL